MDIISLYEDAARDSANKNENGYLSYTMFNRMVIRASIRTLDYITGDSSGIVPPLSYSTQKAKDFISFLITKTDPTLIVNGIITRPADYYGFENLYTLKLSDTGCETEETDCETETPPAEIIDNPVDLLDGQQFNTRKKTYIKGLKPSVDRPIAKMIGKTFEFYPKELDSCVLEYIRYPIAGKIKVMQDPIYYNVVADPATSIACEWEEWAREMLIYFITDSFANHTREQALKQFNEASGKSVRK